MAARGEALGCGCDGSLQGVMARSFTRSLERRGKRRDRGLAKPRRQREERREEREERREKRGGRREERREKSEDRSETTRGRQRSPNEAARGPTSGANPFLGHAAGCWDLWRPQGQREESREKREENRENTEDGFLLFFVKRGRGVTQGCL